MQLDSSKAMNFKRMDSKAANGRRQRDRKDRRSGLVLDKSLILDLQKKRTCFDKMLIEENSKFLKVHIVFR